MRPNLTVNLGLRYEYETVPASENEQSLNVLACVPGLNYLCLAEAPDQQLDASNRYCLFARPNPIDDIDLTLIKRINITERYAIEFSMIAYNILNHPQYVGGFPNNVAPTGATGTDQRLFMEPQSPFFNQITQVWSSNPRNLVLVLKFTFNHYGPLTQRSQSAPLRFKPG